MINKYLLSLLLLPGALLGQTTTGPTYRFFTNLGNIDVTLTPAAAPNTVANFLSYLNAGAYVNSIIARSIPGFVIQGGGYQLVNNTIVATPTNAPVVNEFNVSNTTGTIAMARVGGVVNSATSQWFFNLANNGTNGNALDTTDGGYTVFGNVANASSMAVINKIAALPTVAETGTPNDSSFSNCPLSNGNFVLVTSIAPLPVLTEAGVVSAASSASSLSTGIAPGEFISIYGQNVGPSTGVAATFVNGALPTTLGGIQVTFNGKPAPLLYAGPSQINVVAPSFFSTLPTVDVIVTNNGAASNQLVYNVRPANPAIFVQSPATDAVIVDYTTGQLVNAANPASAGDILILYGEGYGLATAATTQPDGAQVTAPYPVPNDPTTLLLIDGTVIPTLYFGGAPTFVNGTLQVNFQVPAGFKPGTHQIQLQVGTRMSPTGVTLATK